MKKKLIKKNFKNNHQESIRERAWVPSNQIIGSKWRSMDTRIQVYYYYYLMIITKRLNMLVIHWKRERERERDDDDDDDDSLLSMKLLVI